MIKGKIYAKANGCRLSVHGRSILLELSVFEEEPIFGDVKIVDKFDNLNFYIYTSTLGEVIVRKGDWLTLDSIHHLRDFIAAYYAFTDSCDFSAYIGTSYLTHLENER